MRACLSVCVCVCVCVRERERERESMWVCERENVGACVRVCVRALPCVSAWVHVYAFSFLRQSVNEPTIVNVKQPSFSCLREFYLSLSVVIQFDCCVVAVVVTAVDGAAFAALVPPTPPSLTLPVLTSSPLRSSQPVFVVVSPTSATAG